VLREEIPRDQLLRDIAAGIIVGIVALPLAIAFAIASGVEPVRGLVTAIVAGFLISLLSGSRVQIGGPTGAFVVLVSTIVHVHGYSGLAVSTLMAGTLMVCLGLVGFGKVIRFIPYPVTVGFTTGIAVIILTGQIPEALGLSLANPPAEFLARLAVYSHHASDLNPWALAVSVGTIAIVIGWSRVSHRVPGSLIAILLTTILVHLFHLPIETIGSRFGEVASALPRPHWPEMSWPQIRDLVSPALAIALLGSIESLLSAVVADGMTGRTHRPNAELVAQGIANMASALFGGIPATGAIARTATNVKSGGRTPIAGIVHAATLLLLLVAFGRWAALIPMATLAGILAVVAYHMSEIGLFLHLFRSPKSDVLVLLSTFGLTVLVDLVVAIQVGVVLAALLFMRRMAEVTEVGSVVEEAGDEDGDDPDRLRRSTVPDGIEVFEVSGPFFFGAVDKFRLALARVDRPPQVMVLRMRKVPALDATALRVLEDVLAQCRRQGTGLVLSGVQPQPSSVLRRAGYLERLGADNVTEDIARALTRAGELMAAADGESAMPRAGH
jgi:sulfate permease, SulP family